jgi:hypothetical protein
VAVEEERRAAAEAREARMQMKSAGVQHAAALEEQRVAQRRTALEDRLNAAACRCALPFQFPHLHPSCPTGAALDAPRGQLCPAGCCDGPCARYHVCVHRRLAYLEDIRDRAVHGAGAELAAPGSPSTTHPALSPVDGGRRVEPPGSPSAPPGARHASPCPGKATEADRPLLTTAGPGAATEATAVCHAHGPHCSQLAFLAS